MGIPRKGCITGILVCLLVPLAGFAPLPQGGTDDEPQAHITQVDTSAFPKVTVYVSVTDASG